MHVNIVSLVVVILMVQLVAFMIVSLGLLKESPGDERCCRKRCFCQRPRLQTLRPPIEYVAAKSFHTLRADMDLQTPGTPGLLWKRQA